MFCYVLISYKLGATSKLFLPKLDFSTPTLTLILAQTIAYFHTLILTQT